MFRRLILIYAGLSIAEAATIEDICPTQFVNSGEILATLDDTCYRFVVDEQFTWHQAQDLCAADGGNLVVITDAEQQDFIFSSFYELGLTKNSWIGLIRDDMNEPFNTWVDGTPVGYTNWNEGEGEVGSGDTCVVMSMSKEGGWNERTCSVDDYIQAYVCQYREASVEELCPTEFVADETQILAALGDTCYRFVDDVQLDWQVAQEICEADGGNLVVITSAEHQDLIYSTFESLSLDDNPWIGLSREDESEEFTTWVDGTPVEYTNWNDGEGEAGSGGNCVVLEMNKGGGWNERQCTFDAYHQGYACQYKNSAESLVKELCPAQFLADETQTLAALGDTCYRFVDDVQIDWQDAQEKCEADGGDLAAITSAELQGLIYGNFNLLGLRANPWIGLSREMTSVPFTTWVDGTPLDYTNWNKGEGEAGSGHNCVVIEIVTGGKWNERQCSYDEWQKGYVCQYKRPVTTTSVSSSTTETSAGPTMVSTTTSLDMDSTMDIKSTKDSLNPTDYTTKTLTYTTEAEDLHVWDCHFDCRDVDCGMNGFKADPDTYCPLCECNTV